MKLSNPFISILLIALLVTCILSFWIYPQELLIQTNSGGLISISDYISESFQIWISFFVMLLNLALVSFFLKRFKIIEHNIIEVYFFFLLGYASIGFSYISLETSIALLALIFGVQSFLKIHQQPNVMREIANASFWVAISALFQTQMIAFILVILAGILWFRAFSIKEILVSLICFSLPFIYFFSYRYLLDYDAEWPNPNRLFIWQADFSFTSLGLIAGFSYLLFSTLAFSQIMNQRQKLTVKERNQVQFLGLIILFGATLGVFFYTGIQSLVFLSFFMSFFMASFYHYFKRKWILNLFLGAIFIMLMIAQRSLIA